MPGRLASALILSALVLGGNAVADSGIAKRVAPCMTYHRTVQLD